MRLPKLSLMSMMMCIVAMVVLYTSVVEGLLRRSREGSETLIPSPSPVKLAGDEKHSDHGPRSLVVPEELPAGGVLCRYANGVGSEDGLGNGGDNTAGITDEDITRWAGKRILPLSKGPTPGGVEPQNTVWKLLAPWLQVGETYPDPIMLQLQHAPSQGPSIGEYYALHHPAASVVSLEAHPRSAPDLANFIHVALPKNPVLYEPLFASCHLFNTALLLGRWREFQGGKLAEKVANLSRVTYVEVGRGEKTGLEGVTHLELTPVIDTGSSVIHRVVLKELSRGCRKTWVAPVVQWGRSTTLQYERGTGVVRFKVVSKKKKLGREIHPMAFIPHINLETLAALGLTEGQRIQLFGQQLGVSRYPDPMVHNWIWAGGLKRIDKVDQRYETDVNETATYWGTSTLGYFTLLTDNICLHQQPSGFPSLPSSCVESCSCCVKSCSYAPKCNPPAPGCTWGQPICPACLKCSTCLATSDPSTHHVAKQCPFDKYSSWSQASRVWRKWKKKADEHKVKESWYKAC